MRAVLAVVAAALGGWGCAGGTAPPVAGTGDDGGVRPDATAPEDGSSSASLHPLPFLWGAATAGFQVDMGCPTLARAACADPNSDWYVFVTSPELLDDPVAALSGQDPAVVGPGHWELYEQDLDLVAGDLGLDALRMSIEWSRIFPQPTDALESDDALDLAANAEAVAHYRAVFGAARERGLHVVVTLNHYTLPAWLHDAVGCHADLDACENRGWLDRERIVREAARYAGFVARQFGDVVDLWATLNEPLAVVLAGYLLPSPTRSNPPAVIGRGQEARDAVLAMIEAHARMVDAVRANDRVDADGDGSAALVGVVYNLAPVRPADADKDLDVEAAANVDYLWNWWFLDGALLGRVDPEANGHGEVRQDLAGRADWLGVNYYGAIRVAGAPEPVLPSLSGLTTFDPLSLQVNVDDPEGLREMLQRAAQRYHLPLLVTENGRAYEGDDEPVIASLVRHVRALQQAREDGVDVRGYLYWTLMDNYEWNHGMTMRFGLYAVDASDPAKQRRARGAAAVLRAIAAEGGVSDALWAQYGREAREP